MKQDQATVVLCTSFTCLASGASKQELNMLVAVNYSVVRTLESVRCWH